MSDIIRPIRPDELPLMETFLYEAIFQRDPNHRLPRDVIFRPELYLYIDQFGTRRGDLCFCAERDGRVVGMAWTRVIPAYGHVDDETPEFAISLLPEARGQGLGTRLMRAALEALRNEGWRQASLSVQKDNYALRLYQKTGFRTIRETEEEYIMLRELS